MRAKTGSPIAAVMIYAPAWEEGLRWYARAFPDAELVTAGAPFAFLEYDGVNIEIVNSDEKVTSGVSGTVVYWNTDSFEARMEYLVSIGAELFRGPMVLSNGTRMCQLKDPFGNALGLREVV